MSVLFAIKGLHQAVGGAERVICELCSRLAERGHEISLLSFDAAQAEPFYAVSPKVCQIRLGIGDPLKPTTPAEFVKRLLRLRRQVVGMRPRLVVAFMHSMFVPMGLALAGTRIPVIASEHIVREHYRDRPGQLLLVLLAMPFIANVTFLTREIGAQYPWLIRRKLVPMPNPVSAQFRNGAPESLSTGSREILSIGRLVAQKDHATLIAAFAQIAAEFPNWRLRIIGEGELRASLEAQIATLNLQDRILLPGVSSAIADDLARCEFFVLPSRYESFGLAVAEAMAVGKACLGFSDCPGIDALIKNGETGLLVSGKDRVAALSEAMRQLILRPGLREEIGRKAWHYTRDRYSLERVCEQWEALLQRVG